MSVEHPAATFVRPVATEDFALDRPGAGEELRELVAACDATDDVATLNERAILRLRNHGLDGCRLWLAHAPDGTATGFALRASIDLDLAVHPRVRGAGVGTALAGAALSEAREAGIGEVDAWSHADDPAAARMAERFGFSRERELLVMSRPAALPLTVEAPPPGVVIRSYRPEDADALLAINRAAFAHHPEQGGMSANDLAERTAEDWFDPDGLFLAFDTDERLLGFHWTKVHHEESPAFGEVYVVAVDPAAGGRGLGTLLTGTGLKHLAGSGVDDVILYVEADNGAAVAVYRKLGFATIRTEAQYRGAPTRG